MYTPASLVKGLAAYHNHRHDLLLATHPRSAAASTHPHPSAPAHPHLPGRTATMEYYDYEGTDPRFRSHPDYVSRGTRVQIFR